MVRSLAAIDRCDVALILIDATEGVTEQDSKIAGYVDEKGKAAIIVVNKWDLVEKDTRTMEKFAEKIRQELKFMDLRAHPVPLRPDRAAGEPGHGPGALRSTGRPARGSPPACSTTYWPTPRPPCSPPPPPGGG